MTTRYEEAAVRFYRKTFPAHIRPLPDDIRELADLLELYANEVPRAAPDTVSDWREISNSDPKMYERIYEPVIQNNDLARAINFVGSISCFRAGPCWMLICNGRILRQSELYEDGRTGGSSIANVQADCDDFRDRVVAMWNAPRP